MAEGILLLLPSCFFFSAQLQQKWRLPPSLLPSPLQPYHGSDSRDAGLWLSPYQPQLRSLWELVLPSKWGSEQG